jgi:hypothetical protein
MSSEWLETRIVAAAEAEEEMEEPAVEVGKWVNSRWWDYNSWQWRDSWGWVKTAAKVEKGRGKDWQRRNNIDTRGGAKLIERLEALEEEAEARLARISELEEEVRAMKVLVYHLCQ